MNEKVKVYKTTFQLRRGTSEVWERNNPILAYGEPGYDKDKKALKVGDGVTAWNDLNFLSGSSSESIIKQIQADWNQNDSDADNYVKNRTHWEEKNLIEVLPKTTLEFASPGYDGSQNVGKFVLNTEDTYIIMWDDTEYSCTCYNFSGNAIGNSSIFAGGTDTGEPFFIFDSGKVISVTTGTHTVAVYKDSTVIHKIDEKYLPDYIGIQSDWNQNNENAKDYIKNRPFYEEEKWFAFADEQIVTLNNASGYTDFTKVSSVSDFYWNQQFKVIFDGVEYEGKVTEDSDMVENISFYVEGNWVTIYNSPSIRASANLDGEHTIAIYLYDTFITVLPEKYVPYLDDYLNKKMNNTNPVGTGSFSMNRKRYSSIGDYSFAAGYNNIASGNYSYVEGSNNLASGDYSHVEGLGNTANGDHQHINGKFSVLDYEKTKPVLSNVKTNKRLNRQVGTYKYSNNYIFNESTKEFFLAEPVLKAYGYELELINNIYIQLSDGVFFKDVNATFINNNYADFNMYKMEYVVLADCHYANIVGNGTSDTERSNAHTLDWKGVGWYQGGLQVGGNAQDDGAKNVLLEGDAIPVPANATVGQTIVAKVVSDNGVPTEWEAVDFPTASGFVVQDTAPEDTSLLWVDPDDETVDGNLLDNYYTKQEIKALPVSSFTNDAGYLTEHQDLSGYVQKADLEPFAIVADLETMTTDKTSIEVIEATEHGKTVLFSINNRIILPLYYVDKVDMSVCFSFMAEGVQFLFMLNGNKLTQGLYIYAYQEDIPTRVSQLENDAGYATTGEIPTDEHINSLINTALGVIENGTY